MKLQNLVLPLGIAVVLAACGGGGGGTTATSAGSGVVPNVPSATSTPATVASSAPASTTAPLAAATNTPYPLNAESVDPATIGTNALFGNSAVVQVASTITALPNIDDVASAYNFPDGGFHLHSHLTILDAQGNRIIIPLGIGMRGYDPNPLRADGTFPLTTSTDGGISGTYSLHTHDHSGIIHVEQVPSAPQQSYTLGELLDVWGITADRTHFGPATGSIHAYVSHVYVTQVGTDSATDALMEIQPAPTEWTGDLRSLPLQSLTDITIETTDTYFPVPRYYYPGYWCQAIVTNPSDPTSGKANCANDAPPAGVVAANQVRRPLGVADKESGY